VKEILQKGLYQEEIDQLIQLCEDNFDNDPITFFILISILNSILSDFWEIGQVSKEDYDRLENSLAPAILAVWENSGEVRKSALEKLINVFRSLKF
jgi:hypothetical protein